MFRTQTNKQNKTNKNQDLLACCNLSILSKYKDAIGIKEEEEEEDEKEEEEISADQRW